MGTILKKSVDWSDTDATSILPGESIDKAIVSLQIPKVLINEAIQVLYAKNLNWQSDCIISNPRIFKGEAIQVLLRQKIWIAQGLFHFKLQNFLDEAIQVLLHKKICIVEAMKRYNYFYHYFYLKWLYESHISVGGMKGFTDLILP